MYALPTTLPYIDLLPGPFLLLIFIPLLPLALFSLGARPPSGSSLDFLTEELWRTTALLGVAVTVALCVGVYPGSLDGVVGWIKEGNLSFTSVIGGNDYLAIGRSWFGASRARSVGTAAGRRAIRRAKPNFERIATNHIAALRYYYPRAYNASQPKPVTVLVLGIVVTLFIIVASGKILQGMYEADSSPSSSSSQRQSAPSSSSSSTKKPSAWVTHEYEQRKKETDNPDITKKRFKEEEEKLVKKYEGRKKEYKEKGKVGDWDKYIEGKSRERDKDLKELKRLLEKKGIQGVGLDKMPKWYIKLQAKGEDDSKEKTGKAKEAKEVKAEKSKAKTKDPSEATMADKIKSALLGKTLSAARKREKQKAAGGGGAVVMTPGTAVAPAAAIPQRGPGWEVSQDPSTSTGLARSAGNAEALARGLGK